MPPTVRDSASKPLDSNAHFPTGSEAPSYEASRPPIGWADQLPFEAGLGQTGISSYHYRPPSELLVIGEKTRPLTLEAQARGLENLMGPRTSPPMHEGVSLPIVVSLAVALYFRPIVDGVQRFFSYVGASLQHVWNAWRSMPAVPFGVAGIFLGAWAFGRSNQVIGLEGASEKSYALKNREGQTVARLIEISTKSGLRLWLGEAAENLVWVRHNGAWVQIRDKKISVHLTEGDLIFVGSANPTRGLTSMDPTRDRLLQVEFIENGKWRLAELEPERVSLVDEPVEAFSAERVLNGLLGDASVAAEFLLPPEAQRIFDRAPLTPGQKVAVVEGVFQYVVRSSPVNLRESLRKAFGPTSVSKNLESAKSILDSLAELQIPAATHEVLLKQLLSSTDGRATLEPLLKLQGILAKEADFNAEKTGGLLAQLLLVSHGQEHKVIDAVVTVLDIYRDKSTELTASEFVTVVEAILSRKRGDSGPKFKDLLHLLLLMKKLKKSEKDAERGAKERMEFFVYLAGIYKEKFWPALAYIANFRDDMRDFWASLQHLNIVDAFVAMRDRSGIDAFLTIESRP